MAQKGSNAQTGKKPAPKPEMQAQATSVKKTAPLMHQATSVKKTAPVRAKK